MGRLDEALKYGKRAKELIEPMQSDGEFVRFTLSGLGMTYYFRGDCTEARKIGEHLLRFGQGRSDLRCMAMGHTCIGFLMKNIPLSNKKAVEYYGKAIEVARKIGAKGTLGVVCLELGILYQLRKKPEMAKTYISESIKPFRECKAKGHLKKANNIMKSL